jgi:hypothetical protein
LFEIGLTQFFWMMGGIRIFIKGWNERGME